MKKTDKLRHGYCAGPENRDKLTLAIACTEDLLASLCILQDEECNELLNLDELIKVISEKRSFLEEYYKNEKN